MANDNATEKSGEICNTFLTIRTYFEKPDPSNCQEKIVKIKLKEKTFSLWARAEFLGFIV